MSSIALALVCASVVLADSLYGIQVLNISPQDERAVIKTADSKTQVIKPGDVISSDQTKANSGQQSAVSGQEKTTSSQRSASSSQQKQEKNNATLTVIEIAEGSVVLEERQGNDKGTVIIRMKDGKQTVERIRKTAPVNRQQLKAAVSTQQSKKSNSKFQAER